MYDYDARLVANNLKPELRDKLGSGYLLVLV
jgi:hypothetical protein